MQAFEFVTRLDGSQTLSVPGEIVARIQPEREVRVILLVAETDSDAAWSRMTAEQFFKGYDDGDAIYDAVSSR